MVWSSSVARLDKSLVLMRSYIGGWGVSPSPTGKSFRFVRACVRAVWLPSGIGSQIRWARLFPFPFWPGLVVGLFLFCLGWSGGAFLFSHVKSK